VPEDGFASFYARTRQEWRGWLAEHGQSEKRVWLAIYRKGTSKPSVRFHDAIEDALCFGWVDSKAIPRDAESCYLCFTPRNPKSAWGHVNRERAERLIEQGLMMAPGQAMIDLGKATGTWDRFADAQRGVVPPDLQAKFDADEIAARNFAGFPPSSKRLILQWIESAKRPETRARRVAQTAELAAQNVRANHR
jgi:uncharacterized protein YdeI (YjbR/CyaY-like superfamily)